MAYCRWSSPSDVYAYHAGEGVQIHVSTGRIAPGPYPKDPPLSELKAPDWLRRHQAHLEWMASEDVDNYREAVDHPEAGSNYMLAHREAAAVLTIWRLEGMKIPQYAIDFILEDAADLEEDGSCNSCGVRWLDDENEWGICNECGEIVCRDCANPDNCVTCEENEEKDVA